MGQNELKTKLLVDRLATEFESSLRADANISIETVLASAPENLQSDPDAMAELFRELLATDVGFRMAKGEAVTASAYIERFADYQDVVAETMSNDGTVGITQLDDTDRGVAETQVASRLPADLKCESDFALPHSFGRYELRQLLGRGGMGAVYLARDTKLDRNVAIKFPEFARNLDRAKQAIERFHREARSMANVEHPNLCPIFDVGEFDGRVFLTMSYVEGTTLADRLPDGQSLEPREAIRIVERLADAVQVAHDAGIVHRDLKPANVMMNSRNEPILMDFGLATRDQELDSGLTSEGMVLGSPAYMAPEQVAAAHDQIGPRTDVYALGVILYQLLCGRRPYDGPGLAVLGDISAGKLPPRPSKVANVGRKLEAICFKAMAPELNKRYGRASELRDALLQVGDGVTNRVKASPGMRSAVIVAGVLLLFTAAGFSVHRAFTRDHNLDAVDAKVTEFDFLSASYSVLEGNETRQTSIVELARNNIDAAETVEVALAGDTATAGSDFTAGSVTVHFAEGESIRPVPIELLGDTAVEFDESLRLSLTHFTGPGQPGTTHPETTLTIQTDDAFVDFGELTGQSNGAVTACGIRISLDSGDILGDLDGNLLASTITADSQVFRDRFSVGSLRQQIFPALRLEDVSETDVVLEFSERLPTGASLIIVDLDGNAQCTIQIDQKPPAGVPEQIATRSVGGETFPGFDPETGLLTSQGIPSNDEGTVFNLSGASTIRIKSGGSGGYTRAAVFLPVFDRAPETAEDQRDPGNQVWFNHHAANPDLQLHEQTEQRANASTAQKFTSDQYEWTMPTELRFQGSEQPAVSAVSVSSGGRMMAMATWRHETDSMDIVVSSLTADDETWTSPSPLSSIINTSMNDESPALSDDGRILVYASDRSEGYGFYDLWMAERESVDAPFNEPVNLGPDINSSGSDAAPWLSADGLTLMYHSENPEGYGKLDLWMCRRNSVKESFEQPKNIGAAVNTEEDEFDGVLSADGTVLVHGFGDKGLRLRTRLSPSEEFGDAVLLPFTGVLSSARQAFIFEDTVYFSARIDNDLRTLIARRVRKSDSARELTDGSAAQMFTSDRYQWTGPQLVVFQDRGMWHETQDPFVSSDGQEFYVRTWNIPDERFDLHVSRRVKDGTTWGTLEPIPSPIGYPSNQRQPAISSDGLTLVFASDRNGSLGRYDIWFAQRDNLSAPFAEPFNAGSNVNSDKTECNPRLSEDGLTLLFVSYRSDGKGSADLWMCRRDSVTAPFHPAQNLSTVNTSGHEDYFALSSDGTVLLVRGDEFRMYTHQPETDSFIGPARFMPQLEGQRISGFSLSADSKTFYFSCKLDELERQQIWMSQLVSATEPRSQRTSPKHEGN